MGIFLNKVTDQRQLLALTGLSTDEFKELLTSFSTIYKKSRELILQDRLLQTDHSGGGILSDDADKLFFVLFYMKTYPTFDVLSYQFSCCRGTAWNNVSKFLPILRATLASLAVLPARLFESQAALELAFAKADKLLLDATERPTQRPKNKELQTQKYSGKKKTHTLKNTIIASADKEVIYLGNTVFGGSNHDFGLLKKEFKGKETWFENQNVHIDLGYLGFDGVFKAKTTHLPHKKAKKSKNNPNPTLTKEQKEENKQKAATRVPVENTIAGIKKYMILRNKLRTHTPSIEDMSIEIAAGLWNFHQKKSSKTSKRN